MSIESRLILPPKPPRLSLQTTFLTSSQSYFSALLKSGKGDTSPTSLNTILNAYAFAIENVSPRPITCCTKDAQNPGRFPSAHAKVPRSTTCTENEVNLSANSSNIHSPTSNGLDRLHPQALTHTKAKLSNKLNLSPCQYLKTQHQNVPHMKPVKIRSILKNSSRSSPRPSALTGSNRKSVQIPVQTKKNVGYKNPLTQTISTYKYVMSHIELLIENPSNSEEFCAEISKQTTETSVSSIEPENSDAVYVQSSEAHEHKILPVQASNSKTETPTSRKRTYRENMKELKWTINTPDIDPQLEISTNTLPNTPELKKIKLQTPIATLSRLEIGEPTLPMGTDPFSHRHSSETKPIATARNYLDKNLKA